MHPTFKCRAGAYVSSQPKAVEASTIVAPEGRYVIAWGEAWRTPGLPPQETGSPGGAAYSPGHMPPLRGYQSLLRLGISFSRQDTLPISNAPPPPDPARRPGEVGVEELRQV